MKHIPEFVFRAAAVAALALGASASVAGQSGGSQGSTERARAEAEAARSRMERERKQNELNLRIVESEGPRRINNERPDERLDVRQIADDFKLIQLIGQDLMLSTMRAETLDLKLVEKSAAEIKRRASRLGANLVLPKSEKSGKRGAPEVLLDAEELKRSVSTLSELIGGFASNPVFREINRVDAKLSAKARRDLDEIIVLSDRMVKSCEQLGKAAAGQNQ